MLPRRQIRIKVFQTLYSYAQNSEESVEKIKQELKHNLTSYIVLYHIVIDSLILMQEIASEEIKIKLKKLAPSTEDLNPNKKFIKNKIILKIRSKKNKEIDYSKLKRIIKKTFIEVKKSKHYIKYINNSIDSYEVDKKIITHILKKYLIPNEQVHDFLEEYSIYWNDDLIIVFNSIIEKLNNEDNLRINQVFRNNEDQSFANNLINNTLKNDNKLQSIIYKLVENWDIDRIALSDLIVIKMAIAEHLYIQNIPYKVTLDEYIEISKQYSTPKSKEFVNGILDVFIKDILHKK